MRRLKSLLLLLIALWLPIQTAAAAAMPFCRHNPMQAALQSDVAPVATHCHEEAAGTLSDNVDHGLGCDECEMCHLATAGFLLVAAAEPLTPLTTSDFVAGPARDAESFIADPPDQPPRRLS